MPEIIFLKFPLRPSLGGAEFHTVKLARHFADQRRSLKLFTSDPNLFRLFEKNHLPRRRIFIGWEPTAKWSLLLWPLTRLIARRRLKRIVKSASAGTIFYCQSLTEKLILPRLTKEQAVFLEHKIPGRWLKLNPLRFRYLKFAKKIKVITVSEFAKQAWTKFGVPEQNIEVRYPIPIHNPPQSPLKVRGEEKRGLDSAPPLKIRGGREELFTIGILGRLDPEKGVMDFLNSILHVLKTHSDWKVLIAGEGKDEQAIKKLAEKNYLTDKIILLGLVYNLDEFFSQISTLAYPSKVPEAFGMAAAEAISRGIPVVASNIGALPEIIKHGENGFLINHNSEWIDSLEKTA